jgi:hypothetical protein
MKALFTMAGLALFAFTWALVSIMPPKNRQSPECLEIVHDFKMCKEDIECSISTDLMRQFNQCMGM